MPAGAVSMPLQQCDDSLLLFGIAASQTHGAKVYRRLGCYRSMLMKRILRGEIEQIDPRMLDDVEFRFKNPSISIQKLSIHWS
jgi:hypothetical protein